MDLVFQKEFSDHMDKDGEQLAAVCADLGVGFYPITIVPFEHTVVDDSEIRNLKGPVIAYGSNVAEDVVRNYGFNPGWFYINHGERDTMDYFGDHYINSDMMICNTENYLEEIRKNGLYDTEFYFMKPNDTKYFPGTIVDKPMMPFVIQSQGKHFGTPDVYDLCISTVKYIEAEWRFFVVGGQLITGSKYHAENLRLDVQPGYEPDAGEFAQRMIEMFPYENFVIDIARMKDYTYKVVEINCLNSSGFYAIDKRKLVKALKNLGE